jgi:uncharacterized iron-regulated membrane protein
MNALRTCLILTHRYLGIPLSIVFIVWFVSGIVMMYAGGMPTLTPELKLERLAPLDLAAVRLTPRAAAERAGAGAAVGEALLSSTLGRPAYRFRRFGDLSIVFADDGTLLAGLDEADSRNVASRFLGVAEERISFVRTVSEPDQWTLTQARDLPLHKFSVEDENATEVYVSPQSAEVSLVTTRGSRVLAWLGTIPHWFYFTPLRMNQPVWYWTVVWASVVGCVLALLGLVLSITQFRRTQPFRLAASIPYRGWMRWHYMTGALFGVFALTWVFSGLMSMEPFAWTRATGLDVPRDALGDRELDLERYPAVDAAALPSILAGRELKELELMSIQDEPYYVARVTPAGHDAGSGPERQHQPYPLTAGANPDELLIAASSMQLRDEPFSTESLLARLHRAVPDTAIVEHALLSDYDSYYYARNGAAPLPVLRVKFDDPDATWVYVDPRKSELVALTHRSSRLERWLFNGLHSLDFPFWYDKRPLWDIGMILLSLGALATSGIGMYLGFKRLRRDLARLSRP